MIPPSWGVLVATTAGVIGLVEICGVVYDELDRRRRQREGLEDAP